jgi:hypothetical protein
MLPEHFQLYRTQVFSVVGLVPPSVEAGIDDDYYGDDVGAPDAFLEVLLETMGQKPANLTAKAFCGTVIDLPQPIGGVLIEQDAGLNKVGAGGTGGIVWEAGICCGVLLALATAAAEEAAAAVAAAAAVSVGARRGAITRGSKVLELGAGTGIAGLVAALLGADVVLSDQRNIVPLIERNIVANEQAMAARGGAARAAVLDWNDPRERERVARSEEWGLVLCSDLVFGNAYAELIKLLVELQSGSGGRPPLILFAFQLREDRFPSPGFFADLRSHFELVPVTDEEWPPEQRAEHAQTQIFWLELLV